VRHEFKSNKLTTKGQHMSDTHKPAYLIACGTVLDGTPDPEYGRLAAEPAAKANLTAIAMGEPGSERLKVLEGELPAGTSFTAIEQFTDMAALEEFWYSDAYQAAIPHRANSVKMHFVIALDGISEAEREAGRKAHEAKNA
jgi:uncharacterized protein (DUF1330 family)